MLIWNKGHRDFIVSIEEIIFPKGTKVDPKQKRFHIRPDSKQDVTEECGKRLIKAYPREIMRFGEEPKPRGRKQ